MFLLELNLFLSPLFRLYEMTNDSWHDRTMGDDECRGGDDDGDDDDGDDDDIKKGSVFLS